MPRSHLDVHDGSWFWPDDEGSEFSDLEAAEHETTVMAISIGRKLLRNDNERTVTVDVHDDQGQRVTDVTMTVTDETVIMKGRPSDGSARSMRDPVTSRKEIAEPLYPIRSPDGNLLLPVASNDWVGTRSGDHSLRAQIDAIPGGSHGTAFFDVSYKTKRGRRVRPDGRPGGFGRGA